MKRKCTLNKRIMENLRKDTVYQTIIIDLVNCKYINKTNAETLLGYTIPDYLIDSATSDKEQ